MRETSFELPGLDRPLRAALARPGGAAAVPVVVLAHGFKGFMDWGCWPWLGRRLAEAGLACLRFDFSHNGTAGSPGEFTDLAGFQANTFSREVEELRAVLAAARALPGIDPGRVAALGHSRGGAIALLASDRADRVVTWASLAGLEDLHGFRGQEQAWREAGFMAVRNARTGQTLRLGSGLLDDWLTNREALDVEAALRRLVARGKRATAVHGALDPGVPLAHGHRLEAAGARLVVVPGGDHTFGATHPFQPPPPAPLKAALAATLEALDGRVW